MFFLLNRIRFLLTRVGRLPVPFDPQQKVSTGKLRKLRWGIARKKQRFIRFFELIRPRKTVIHSKGVVNCGGSENKILPRFGTRCEYGSVALL